MEIDKYLFNDYVDLTSKIRIYEYLAETNLSWFECAIDDGYDQFLIDLADKYGVEHNSKEWVEYDDGDLREEIYSLENKLWNRLGELVMEQ